MDNGGLPLRKESSKNKNKKWIAFRMWTTVPQVEKYLQSVQ